MEGKKGWKHSEKSDKYVCIPCHRKYEKKRHVVKHLLTSSKHDWCERCNLDFNTAEHLRCHFFDSPEHQYCLHCDEEFENAAALLAHQTEAHAQCKACGLWLSNLDDCYEHGREAHSSRWCEHCKRAFADNWQLLAHLNSGLHTPRTIPCPGAKIGPGCARLFIKLEDTFKHLETNTCPSELTRADVDASARRFDRQCQVTKPGQLRLNNSTHQTTFATQHWWNFAMQAYLCYLCEGRDQLRRFNSLPGLNMHIGAKHYYNDKDKLYFCPAIYCRFESHLLSALCSHVDFGHCGVRNIVEVRQVFETLAKGGVTKTSNMVMYSQPISRFTEICA